jgi:hypothetical protein
LADSAAVASPWRTPLLTTHRLPTRTGQLQSPRRRQAPRAQPMGGRRPFPVIRSHASAGASTALH